MTQRTLQPDRGPSPSRRGSVLVLVVGVLALLAIMALVYATIGQSDRRGAAALVTKSRVDDQSNAIADYLSQLIADNSVAVSYRRYTSPDGTRRDVMVHANRDYPSVDPLMQTATAQPWLKFNPTGSMLAPWGGGQAFDPRTPSTPWLASSEPVWINPNGDAPSDPQHPWIHEGDWMMISNPAPDGRFVNLALLRNNIAIPSGVGPGTITDNLFLLRVTGPGVVQTTLNTENGLGTQGDPNIPAHWTMRQFGMFRPVGDASVAIGDPHNLDNLFADADGDGMYDSRWFELVDAFRYDAGPDGVMGTADDKILAAQSVIPYGGPLRLFCAARIIDLSGNVNINTATTLRVPGQFNLAANPKTWYPLGLFPSDIDLERLLTLRDVYHVYGIGPGDTSYSAQPANGVRASNYAQYETAYDIVGQSGYSGLLTTQLTGTVPATGTTGYLAAGTVPTGFTGLFPNGQFTAATRALLYQTSGRDPSGATLLQVNPDVQFAYSSAFGASDLAELLVYWTINDPARLSRLEAAVDARSDQYPNLGPMRSNRPLDIERTGNNSALAAALFRNKYDVRHLLTTVSGSRPLAPMELPANFDGSAMLGGELRFDMQSALINVLRNNPQQSDVNALFQFYANALLPYSGEGEAWNRNNAQARALHYGGVRTGFVGNAAELALRTAAHMTVNMISNRDRHDEPVLMTLLLDRQQRTTLDGNPNNAEGQPMYPGWEDPQSSSAAPGRPRLTGRLDLEAPNYTVPRLAAAPYNQVPADLSAPALNIYSVTPQPFITQMVSYVMYSDVHEAYGGDGRAAQAPTPPEWRIVPDPGGGPDTLESNPITINGAVRKSNKDFMLEMVAFQIHNPFEVDIALTALDAAGNPVAQGSGVADTDYRFYIEFAGRFFKIADHDVLTGQAPKSVVLRAGETRTFYILGENPADIGARWRTADPNAPELTANAAQIVVDWVNSKIRTSPTDTPIRIVRFDPRTGQALAPGGDEPGVINPQGPAVSSQPDLNRVARLWKALRTGTQGVGVPRSRLNDLLVDRLRDPDNTGRPMLDRRMPARNTQVLGTAAGPDPRSPDFAQFPTPLDNTGYSICYFGSVRRPDNPGGAPPTGAIPAYCVEAKSTVSGHFASHNKQETITGVDPRGPKKADFAPQPGYGPYASTRNEGPRALWIIERNAKLLDSITHAPDQRSGQTIGGSGPGGAGPSFDKLYLQLHKVRAAGTTNDPLPPMRLADLLLPLGVGPYQDPLQTDLDLQWTTLGEAIATALDYDSSSDTSDPLYAIGRADQNPGVPIGAFDRGSLRLDAFAAFDDLNGNGIYEPNQNESLRGDGLPLAYNILTRARINKYGSGSSMVSGVVNINTAPLMVLRSLPMLSPDSFTWAAQAATRPLYTPASERYDLAATLAAYRDKNVRFTRPLIGGSNSPLGVDFRDANDGSRVPADPDPIIAAGDANGRAYVTGIAAIREQPGFASPAEILAARYSGGATLANNLGSMSITAPLDAADVSIDRFGRDDKIFDPRDSAGNPIGVVTTLYGASNQPSAIKDDYSQRLAIADAVLNSISTRSDVFAVWFIVRGYLPTDVNGLGIEDPMIPTLERRYVMVVDRSGVTAKGQKPRILLFEEVPAN